MNTVRQYTEPGVHHSIVAHGIIQTSTVRHVWDFSKPKRRPILGSAFMGLILSICAFALILEGTLWMVRR